MSNKTIKIALLALIALLIIIIGSNYFNWQRNYRGRIYPQVKVGQLNLAGKTLVEARETISAETRKIESDGLSFRYEDRQQVINFSISSFDADLSYPALTFDLDATLAPVFDQQKNNSFLNFFFSRLNFIKARHFPAVYRLDQTKTRQLISEAFPDLDIPAKNASFSLENRTRATSSLIVAPERLGKTINYEAALIQLQTRLDQLIVTPIEISTQTSYPTVLAVDLADIQPRAEEMINSGAWQLSFINPADQSAAEKLWDVPAKTVADWLAVERVDGRISMSLDKQKVKDYLEKEIAPEIDQEIVRPRFEIKNDRVASWQIGKNGRQLDSEISANNIEVAFLTEVPTKASLAVKELLSEEITADNDFQIEELLGTGHSNFSGSPSNRRHNIRVGADALHGILIKPGEEFSLIKTLGEIDASTGYLPELVIKGDKTVPEYGGGLCQIGTTAFRTTLASGLPITARQNHSYRVSYYEPAGTDATIYDPYPDFRFINDTGSYVLIQARIEGNDLYFDFWGKSDGRTATTTYPTIYNIVKPAPTKIIETTDLAPGQKKCTERAHNGADAFFDYTVVYPENSTTSPVQTRRFSSHYIPWREVCLVGVESASSTTAASSSETSTASSSPQE